MSSLRELQAGFRAALLADDERGVAPDVVDDGLSASARLAVYRHHVFTTLTAALEATYPVVCRLVDRRFFGWVADQYVRVRPPAGPCLFEYGADFPEFVAAFPACAHLPWLADVARLEVRRVDDGVVFRALPPATFALRAALAAGRTLEDAVEQALDTDPAFDLAVEIRALLDEGVLVRPE